MILLADESVDRPVVQRLRVEGHETVYVAEVSPSISDDEVLALANNRGALLLTADKDFGELVYRHKRVHGGVVLLRLDGLSLADKADIVATVLMQRGQELHGAFSVISPGIVRIRRPDPPGALA
jgi:predicted nuclease of predicted toxin-antitoxin system